MGTITLPSDLLHALLLGAALLCRPVVLLLSLLALLALLASGLLLPCGIVLLLLLLTLLALLASSLLLLFRGIVLLLTLLLLLTPGLLLLLFRGIVLLLLFLLPLLVLLLSSCLRLLLLALMILLPRALLLLLFRFSFFFLFVLPRISWSSDSQEQETCSHGKDSNSFHGVASDESTYAPVFRPRRGVSCQAPSSFGLSRASIVRSSTDVDTREGVE